MKPRTFEGPGLQTPPKFHEKTPREKKERKWWRENDKKREILGPPAFGAPPCDPHRSPKSGRKKWCGPKQVASLHGRHLRCCTSRGPLGKPRSEGVQLTMQVSCQVPPWSFNKPRGPREGLEGQCGESAKRIPISCIGKQRAGSLVEVAVWSSPKNVKTSTSSTTKAPHCPVRGKMLQQVRADGNQGHDQPQSKPFLSDRLVKFWYTKHPVENFLLVRNGFDNTAAHQRRHQQHATASTCLWPATTWFQAQHRIVELAVRCSRLCRCKHCHRLQLGANTGPHAQLKGRRHGHKPRPSCENPSEPKGQNNR